MTITAEEIWNRGERLEDWAIDEDRDGELESNAGIQGLFKYDRKYYLLCFDDDGCRPNTLNEIDIEEEIALDEDSFVLQIIEENEGYVVISTTEKDDETDEPLYWSNDDGWVDLGSATRFSSEEKKKLDLPIGGKWKLIVR
jgi:hypothetical protein